MSTGSIIAVAVVFFVLLAAVVVFTTAGRRDRNIATGGLSRETRRKDRGDLASDAVPASVGARSSAAEVEREARERRTGSSVVVAPPPAPPAPYIPPDPETLGVTRRQFLNRGIINMFGLGLGAFGAACLAFLWPRATGGFGAKITLPASLSEILEYYNTNREPYYYAPGRVYMSPYPKEAVAKAKNVTAYSPGVVAGMEEGLIANYQKCVHLGCRVPWCKTSQWFECPCHGSQYNRVGEQKGGPAPRGMDHFGVSVSGGRVQVDTGLVIQGPPLGTDTTGQEAEGPHCVSGAAEH